MKSAMTGYQKSKCSSKLDGKMVEKCSRD